MFSSLFGSGTNTSCSLTDSSIKRENKHVYFTIEKGTGTEAGTITATASPIDLTRDDEMSSINPISNSGPTPIRAPTPSAAPVPTLVPFLIPATDIEVDAQVEAEAETETETETEAEAEADVEAEAEAKLHGYAEVDDNDAHVDLFGDSSYDVEVEGEGEQDQDQHLDQWKDEEDQDYDSNDEQDQSTHLTQRQFKALLTSALDDFESRRSSSRPKVRFTRMIGTMSSCMSSSLMILALFLIVCVLLIHMAILAKNYIRI